MFVPYDWPPGRACREGAKEMIRYDGKLGSYMDDFKGILDGLTKTNRLDLATFLIETMYAAQRGELIADNVEGGVPGAQVTQLRHSSRQILEIRLEKIEEWTREWFPRQRLRVYFAEPRDRDEIWWLHLAPKAASGNWYEEQNRHIDQAANRARDWAQNGH